jgi:ribonuclease Z
LIDPCIGYVFRETREPQRKIVVLGDTSDPTGILPLCDQPTLLIHEATDAYMTSDINPYERRTQEVIYARSLDRGHSIPAQAGAFARKIGAQGLVLNHIGSRYVCFSHCRFRIFDETARK